MREARGLKTRYYILCMLYMCTCVSVYIYTHMYIYIERFFILYVLYMIEDECMYTCVHYLLFMAYYMQYLTYFILYSMLCEILSVLVVKRRRHGSYITRTLIGRLCKYHTGTFCPSIIWPYLSFMLTVAHINRGISWFKAFLNITRTRRTHAQRKQSGAPVHKSAQGEKGRAKSRLARTGLQEVKSQMESRTRDSKLPSKPIKRPS